MFLKRMKYVSYFRVSTDKQGIRGLGMEAQREAVSRQVNGGEVVGEFQEVESGKRRDRPELVKALARCRECGATLVIAKLDRLARNAAFVLGLRDSGVEFVCCDYPQANRLTIGILAVVAEHEREMISARTKDALQAAKRRGQKLGNPRPLAALEVANEKRMRDRSEFVARRRKEVQEITEAGVKSLRGIARALNARGIKSLTGRNFTAQTVRGILC